MEKEVVVEDLSVVLDHNYLLEHVGWGIGGADDPVIFIGKYPVTWFWYDQSDNSIREFVFDKVMCMGYHSFAGTNFSKFFKNKFIIHQFQAATGEYLCEDNLMIAPTKHMLLGQLVDNGNRIIDDLHDQLDNIPHRISELSEKIATWEEEIFKLNNKTL